MPRIATPLLTIVNEPIDNPAKVAYYPLMRHPRRGNREQMMIDHLYPYIDEYMAAEPVEIRSRKHYLQELKKRGLQERGNERTGRWV